MEELKRFVIYFTGGVGPQGPPGEAGELIASTDGWKFKVHPIKFKMAHLYEVLKPIQS